MDRIMEKTNEYNIYERNNNSERTTCLDFAQKLSTTTSLFFFVVSKM